MRVLVCGSRTWHDPARLVDAVLQGLYDEHECGFGVLHLTPFTVIEGGAVGADDAARQWAHLSPLHPTAGESMPGFDGYPAVEHLRFNADWDSHGRAAGPIRNQKMLDEGRPNLVLAFVDKPLAESRGTADMVGRAQRRDMPTYVIERV